MPSRNPRLILTVPPDLMGTIRELSAALEKPMATVVLDLLREMQPQLRDLVKLVLHTRAGRTEAAKRTLSHMVGDQLAQLLVAQQGDMFKDKGK